MRIPSRLLKDIIGLSARGLFVSIGVTAGLVALGFFARFFLLMMQGYEITLYEPNLVIATNEFALAVAGFFSLGYLFYRWATLEGRVLRLKRRLDESVKPKNGNVSQ